LTNIFQQRLQFETKDGTAKRIKLDNKKIRLLLFKQLIKCRFAFMLNLFDALAGAFCPPAIRVTS